MLLIITSIGNTAIARSPEPDDSYNYTKSAFSKNSKVSIDISSFTNGTAELDLYRLSSKLSDQQEPNPVPKLTTIALSQGALSDTIVGKKPLGWSTLDFSTPSSPGARIIGYKGDIGSVTTPNELAIKLLTGLDSDGNGSFQTGFAIDMSPYLIIRGTDFTLADYRDPNHGFQRFLANTKISIATSKSDTTTRIGIGAEFILIDDGDLRFDDKLFERFKTILSNQPAPSPSRPVPPPNPTPDLQKKYDNELQQYEEAEIKKFEAYNISIKADITAAKKEARKRAAQKPIWNLGIATSLISPTGRYFNFGSDGMGVWTTYKRGIGGDSELIFHGSYRSGERIFDRTGGFFNGDTLTLGTRIRTGSEDFKFSLETAYNIENQSGKSSNNYLSFGLGLEPKVSDDLWLSLSMNGATGRQNGTDFQLFSGVKWNFNNGK